MWTEMLAYHSGNSNFIRQPHLFSKIVSINRKPNSRRWRADNWYKLGLLLLPFATCSTFQHNL